jgi:LysM repeat protein
MRRGLAFVLAGALAVAACGGGATPTPEPSPSVTPAPTDIYAQSPSPSDAASTAPDASAAPSARVGGKTYTVKKNDTMWAISQKLGITLAALIAANPTVDPTKMRIGAVLVIPPK